jgi:hypothetical protein
MPLDPIQTLTGLRTAVGVGSWAAPGRAGRAFGLDVRANPQAPYIARLFGIRDLALAAGVVRSSGAERRRWLQIGVVCDAFDVAAAALARRDGSLSPASAAMCGATAVGAVALGLAALRREA